MSSMSHSFDHRREANGGSTLLAALDGLFQRFLLRMWPSEIFDVFRHVFADVCLPARFPRLQPGIPSCLIENRKLNVCCIAYREVCCFIRRPHLAPTSTRIPVLSP